MLADEERTLATAWNLGDCNNMFVLLFVTSDGQLVYEHKGVLSEADIQEFYKVLERYQ